MEAEGDGGKIERKKTVEQIAGWVVVRGGEGVGHQDTVMPSLMPLG